MELNLRDKRVLVTGGNGGLGAAMAEACLVFSTR
jgi:NAD(P)-dependent dehydrogenase (short-subunit alcohol dehydrogenase family)